MSHYISKGQVASQFVVAAVTGYFHSISCAANAKGVDDSLQVKCGCFHDIFYIPNPSLSFLHLVMPHRLSPYLASSLYFCCELFCHTGGLFLVCIRKYICLALFLIKHYWFVNEFTL